MKKRIVSFVLLLVVAGCHRPSASGPAPREDQRVMTDMAGRTVIVPEKITRVLGMSPVGTVLVYTLSPELLAGWNYQPDPGELAFYKEPYNHLPVLGGWFGKNNTGNLEEIVKAHPDVLISMGDPMGIAVAERVQQQTHIPVLRISTAICSKLPDAYRDAGDLLGNPERAAALADECRKTLDEIEAKINAIPAEKRRRIYYAEGPTGLETEPGNSVALRGADLCGRENVAAVPGQQGYGHTPVSMEQVCSGIRRSDLRLRSYRSPGEFYRNVWSNPVWKQHGRGAQSRGLRDAAVSL